VCGEGEIFREIVQCKGPCVLGIVPRPEFTSHRLTEEEADNEVERMRILLKSALARKEIDRTHEGLSQAYQTHLEEYNVED